MVLSEYNNMMELFKKNLSKCREKETWEACYDNMVSFQETEMMSFLQEYGDNVKSHAQEIIFSAFEYAIKTSTSGSSIVDIPSKELADKVDEICWEEIGDYLLDYEVYENATHPGKYFLDCMFAGDYVPAWDGWSCEPADLSKKNAST